MWSRCSIGHQNVRVELDIEGEIRISYRVGAKMQALSQAPSKSTEIESRRPTSNFFSSDVQIGYQFKIDFVLIFL